MSTRSDRVARTKAATERLLRVGQRMSNACFNLGQRSSLGDDGETLKCLAAEWDQAKRELNGLVTSPTPTKKGGA